MRVKKPDKKDAYGGLLAVGMLCFVLLLHTAMYPPARLIKQAISHRGYATEGLEIEQISFWRGIYKANVTVTDNDGREVEYWQIATVPYTQTVCYAKPYFETETA